MEQKPDPRFVILWVVAVIFLAIMWAYVLDLDFGFSNEPSHSVNARPNSERISQEEIVRAQEEFHRRTRGDLISPEEEMRIFDEWATTQKEDTVLAYQEFISKNPRAEPVEFARERIEELRRDESLYEQVVERGTENAFKQFLKNFQGHTRENDARKATKLLAAAQGVTEASRKGDVEYQVIGNSITNVKVRLQRKNSQAVALKIPIGTYFKCGNSSAQNMIATRSVKILLSNNDWFELSLSVACANMPKDIPDANDSFTIEQGPEQRELARLVSFMDRDGIWYQVKQAAVWIVTDDASYEDLGRLKTKSSFSPFGERQITEVETAKAMKLCDEAGIDVRRKNIWQDRQKVLRGLEDGELKTWLQKRFQR